MTAAPTPAADQAAEGDAASPAPETTTVVSLVPGHGDDAHGTSAHGAGDHTAGTVATTEHTEEHGSGGLPQLQTEHWAGQIVWLLIIFAVFYALMATVFTPRLRKVISNRGSTIAEDLANARANRDEAEAQAKDAAAETAAAHAAGRKLASEALARSNAEIAEQTAAEDAKLNTRLSEAEARIRAARDTAMAHVTDIAGETAQALVETLTGKAATAAALKSAFGKVS
ncbi:ATP synthase B' chain [Asticcacaulis biprosthecium C19]|uniref:ATP synthase subunit b n=1 Tax=Asticcacaulis biprosthecium C19 TaxID=715226 RepID=F4QRN9_9CAUL|nr:ATPase [Asticcacaulis biprosthecium]EGF90165.1 ATP synthase B' chain [Asticcacaulis biprosthecium C19]